MISGHSRSQTRCSAAGNQSCWCPGCSSHARDLGSAVRNSGSRKPAPGKASYPPSHRRDPQTSAEAAALSPSLGSPGRGSSERGGIGGRALLIRSLSELGLIRNPLYRRTELSPSREGREWGPAERLLTSRSFRVFKGFLFRPRRERPSQPR